MALILASKSPRRRELMALVTPEFTVEAADLDESLYADPSPVVTASNLARAKAAAVSALYLKDLVIGCDTVVELEGATIGKPKDEADAIDMLGRLSGHRHFVHTGVSLFRSGREASYFVETTRVEFSRIPPEEIQVVAKTAEPYDKAGGYGIQGWAARYIPRIEGCYYNVMGLPVAALWEALRALL